MKLIELEPRFVRWEEREDTWTEVQPDGHGIAMHGPRVFFPFVERIEQAQGVKFLCPKCFAANKGPVGTHAVICWSSSRGVPAKAFPGPGRWRLVGTGFQDLTLDVEPGKSRSVLLIGGCAWHGFVTNGEVT